MRLHENPLARIPLLWPTQFRGSPHCPRCENVRLLCNLGQQMTPPAPPSGGEQCPKCPSLYPNHLCLIDTTYVMLWCPTYYLHSSNNMLYFVPYPPAAHGNMEQVQSMSDMRTWLLHR